MTRKNIIYRAGSIAIIVIAIAIAVVMNVIAGMVPIKFDLSDSKIFTLSDTSREIVSSINDNVKIYALYDKSEGKVDPSFNEINMLLEQYNEFKNIETIYIDPVKEPDFVNQIIQNNVNLADKVSNSVIVVENAGRIRAFQLGELFDTSKEQNAVLKNASKIERTITGGIKFVTAEVIPTVYFLDGHSSSDYLNDYLTLRETMLQNNFDVRKLNLDLKTSVPSDAKIVVIVNPDSDLKDNERDMLVKYLENGGDLMVLIDSKSSGEEYSNINRIVRKYNIEIRNDKIEETDPERFSPENRSFIKVDLSYGLVNSSDEENLYLLNARSVNFLRKAENNDEKDIVNFTVAHTSENAISMDMKSDNKTTGEFQIAIAAESNLTDDPARVLVCGNSTFISDTYAALNQENLRGFLGWVSWMQDMEDDNPVEAKLYDSGYIKISYNQAIVLLIIFVAIIPIIIIVIGFVVWLKRRHL